MAGTVSRSSGPPAGARTTWTRPGSMRSTRASKSARIEPSLTRFSRLGRIQYLRLRLKSAPRWTIVTRAPWRCRSSAASAAPLPPPTITHVAAVLGVALAIAVRDVRQVGARHVEGLGVVEVAGGDQHVRRAERRGRAPLGHGLDLEAAGRSPQGGHPGEGAHVQALVRDHLAVVVERFLAGRLVGGGHEGVAADLEALAGGEEGHVGRVGHDRVGDRALLQNDGAQTGALGLDRGLEADGARADDEGVEGGGVGGHGGHRTVGLGSRLVVRVAPGVERMDARPAPLDAT